MAKILVVDDEASVRMLLDRALSAAGHDVVQAENGGVALSLIDEQSFDLVISDIFMPGVDGFEVIRTLRKTHPEQKVIVVSGGPSATVTETDFLRMTELLGAKAALSKPFEVSQLLAAVDDALAA